ncbi:MAG: hypothetical protein FP826_13225 [Sphingomonadales bacterium]|nr:hypothetical protein [Sphingomonadales bacterium]MBU3993282.1 hypothetical protein [Alphaproteobacteria bacterium]
MRARHVLLGAALAATSVWAIAQDAPESLLPPGFDKPARPARAPAAAVQPAAPSPAPVSAPSAAAPAGAGPVVQAIPGTMPGEPAGPVTLPKNLPSLDVLAGMTPDELDAALNLRPRDDIPPAARRAMQRVGLIDEGEGGLPFWNLGRQDATLVRAALAGNSGQMVSRWGHILLRRALASRLDAPAAMDPADFAALRAALLLRMGEGPAARALVQDVDTANFNPALTQAALDAYIATADFTGICPVIALQGSARKDKPWQVLQAICDAFAGEGSRSMASLDRLTYYGAMPRIDMLLAQKYAGAAGKARRAVNIEWDKVSDLTPWRYGMTMAVGLQPPAALMKDAAPAYAFAAATAPMASLGTRAAAAETAAAAGILSSAALVDLYGQIYDEEESSEEWAVRATKLRDAYVAADPADRLAALKSLWDGGGDAQRGYSRQVLTAYAAARFPVSKNYAADAPALIAAMLTAGLDANALRWSGVVDKGSEAWALLALAAPNGGTVDRGTLVDFHDDDNSANARKTRLLVAGLAGLGRLPVSTANELAQQYGFRFDHQSRWAQMIDKAAEYDNPTLVALLAGLGMQGDGWDKMTARNLYHIVAALNRVGLSAEARMIAAEAVARA